MPLVAKVDRYFDDNFERRSAAAGFVNAPSKHHFLPEFYLRRWADAQGLLTRFTEVQPGKFGVRRVHPAQAGFKTNLYRLPGDHNDEMAAQLLEWGFFRQVDNDAARALAILLGEAPWEWAANTRSGWSRFLLSLLRRTPRHWHQVVAEFARLDAETLPEVEGRYAELRASTDPPTFYEWMAARDQDYLKKERFKMAARAIDNTQIGTTINNTEWRIYDLAGADLTLLTSDNAVVLVPIDLQDGHLAIPISPTKLFVAARQRKFHEQLELIASLTPGKLVRSVNRLTVERADEVVIGSDELQRTFIEKNFGTKRITTFGIDDGAADTIVS